MWITREIDKRLESKFQSTIPNSNKEYWILNTIEDIVQKPVDIDLLTAKIAQYTKYSLDLLLHVQ